ncbi:hypothetical protein U9M48_039731 [Paspalum notatum var. saurae]|uniref:Uncharacterized protein n=1 Tax=Paspalum notatum var. saurae TaxID=547442 RepID=A0AAQ3XDF7_PASNO
MLNTLQVGVHQASMIHEKITALSSLEVTTLRQQLADSEAARKAETTAAAAEIARLKHVAMAREIEHRNVIADRDQAKDTAVDLRRNDEYQQLQESRDGFEKSFRETASAMDSLKNSHYLTRQALRDKETELVESQSAFDKVKKVLASTRCALKESRDEAAHQAQVSEVLKKNYETSKRNCNKLKDAFEKAKEAALTANTALIKILDICVPEKAAPRRLSDRITFMDDMKSKISERVQTVLTRVLAVIKNSQPEIDLASLPARIINEGQGADMKMKPARLPNSS